MSRMCVGALILASLVFSADFELHSHATQPRNDLIIGTLQEPSDLNPWVGGPIFMNFTHERDNVFSLLFMGLTYVDSGGVLQPGLAVEIPTLANGRVRLFESEEGQLAGQEVYWTLRSNARWSDGNNITCEDAEFTFEIQKRTDLSIPFPIWSDLVDNVDCDPEDHQSFTITYNAPHVFYANIAGVIGLSRYGDIAPKHIWEAFTDNFSQPESDFLGAPPSVATDSGQVVGSGPYKLESWIKNESMTLERRDDFYLSPPGPTESYLQQIVIRSFTDQDSLLAALASGDIDAVDDISLSNLGPDVVQEQLGDNVFVAVTSDHFIEQLHFNLFEDPEGLAGQFPDQVDCPVARDLLLADPRTRQAIIQAIDREELIAQAPPGFQVSNSKIPNSFVITGDFGFNEDLITWEYDPVAARSLLAELGWEDLDNDGFLERRAEDGREIQFDLPWASTRSREQIGQILSAQLAGIGINVVTEALPGSIFFAEDFLSHGATCSWGGMIEFATSGGIGLAPSDADGLSGELYLNDLLELPTDPESLNVPLSMNSFTGFNVKGWANPQIDRLRAEALHAFDAEARASIIQQMQVIFNEQLPSIPLFERTTFVVFDPGLLNYKKGTPAAITQFVGAWCWGWETAGAVEATC